MSAIRAVSVVALVVAVALFLGQTRPAPVVPSVGVNPQLRMALSSFVDDSSFVKVATVVEPASEKLTAETIKNVQAAGDLLKSIHMTAHVYGEEQPFSPDGRSDWLEAGSVQGEGFLELGSGRERFEYVSHFNDWSHDPRTRDQKIVQVYDGKTSEQVPRQFGEGGYSGPPRPVPIGYPELVGIYFAFPLDMGYEAGPDGRDRGYALYTRLDPADASARRVLLGNTQAAVELTFHHKIHDARITETWYLDADHGYARIASSREVDDHHWIHTVVSRLFAMPGGMDYPEAGVFVMGSNHVGQRRSLFTAGTVTANEAVGDSYFAMPGEAGVGGR